MFGLFESLHFLLSPWPLFFMVLGTSLGIVVGAVPGLTGAMVIALTLPLTFYMKDLHAIILLISIYTGAVSGGLISATLLRIPGTPSSVMTTFDGYPMARGGRPGRALGLGIMASFIGGLVGWVFLYTLSPPLAKLAVRFGPFEYFSMVIMALVLIASASQGSMLKGLYSGILGMLVSMPGVDESAGQVRLTFGFIEFSGGFNLLPVLIGVFAVSQVLSDTISVEQTLERVHLSIKGMFMSLREWVRMGPNLLRSSVIGTWVGILPGIGGNIGSIVAYTTAKTFSKHPERFGTGFEDGIVASESANNASIGGALVPLITMGIPGSVIDALLIGALIIHNIQPGPMLFVNNPEMVYTMIAVCLASNVVMFALMTSAVKPISRLMYVPKGYLLPVIMVFCVAGVFALNNRFFDVWVMMGFGFVGFALERAGIPLGPFCIGLILAPIAEKELRSGLMLSGDSFLPLVTRPASLTFLIISALFLAWPFYKEWQMRRTARRL